MNRRIFSIMISLQALMIGEMALAAGAVKAATTHHNSKEEKKKEISEDEARGIATKEFPGKIIEIEQEEFKGTPVYSVEIKGAKDVHEIAIDKATGKILDNKVANDDEEND